MTRCPRWASSVALASPNPDDAPVMRIVFAAAIGLSTL
jgi:hypothetical protein